MTAKELLQKLECLEYGYGADNKEKEDSCNLQCLPIVISTENGTEEIKSVILRNDYLAPYCRVIELSTKAFIKDEETQAEQKEQ